VTPTKQGSSRRYIEVLVYECIKWWRGAESNRRHYDFQSVRIENKNSRNSERSAILLVESDGRKITDNAKGYEDYEAPGTNPGTGGKQ